MLCLSPFLVLVNLFDSNNIVVVIFSASIILTSLSAFDLGGERGIIFLCSRIFE